MREPAVTGHQRPALGTDPADWSRTGSFRLAPGLHRVPLPLPSNSLAAVNVYVLDTDDGVALIDAGWGFGHIQPELEDGLAAVGRRASDVTAVVVTHVHRDHYPQASAVRRSSGATVMLGSGEHESLDIYLRGDGSTMRQRLDRVRSGGAAELADAHAGAGAAQSIGWELPDTWLTDGARLEVGGRALTVLHTPGHTRGHLCFWDEDSRVLFAGDHVLPHITPSIGFEPAVDRQALGNYLSSLQRLLTLPDGALLPAHGPPSDGFHQRVHELIEHHRVRLDLASAAVAAGSRTAFDVARRLPWTRRGRSFDSLGAYDQLLAVSETAAHLDLLVERGALWSSRVGEVWTYVP